VVVVEEQEVSGMPTDHRINRSVFVPICSQKTRDLKLSILPVEADYLARNTPE
jgi:hypothetical protein